MSSSEFTLRSQMARWIVASVMKVSITGVKGYFHQPENQYMWVLWSAPSRQPNNKSILYLADSTKNMDQWSKYNQTNCHLNLIKYKDRTLCNIPLTNAISRLKAVASSPVLLKAKARLRTVGGGWFGGAHFSHWLSISLKKPGQPSGMSNGILLMISSSLLQNPRYTPTFLQWGTALLSRSKRFGSSLSPKMSSTLPARGAEMVWWANSVCIAYLF